MSKKSGRIAERISKLEGGLWEVHYLGYFDCFNKGEYYEAHDVLEELWLSEGKSGLNYSFYKGLIQLAGAFVHVQKNRAKPAIALLDLANSNLEKYRPIHQGVSMENIIRLITHWKTKLQDRIETTELGLLLQSTSAPRLTLPTEVSPIRHFIG